jgi:hypothetical protein
MIVPRYWAEGRVQFRSRERQVTVRRFGWSDFSPAEAQAMADARTKEAFDRVMAGESLRRSERKVAYNGAEGVPIREEIVARSGPTVITRNSYGARCLNTPNVLFADVDLDDGPRLSVTCLGILAGFGLALAVGVGTRSMFVGTIVLVLVAVFGTSVIRRLCRNIRRSGSAERRARVRVQQFLAAHPEWSFRVYRTPAGLRLLAMHRTFDPREPDVAACFRELGCDPVYARMCVNQNCFRARVSPKPWRIGIAAHLKPRPGVWPVSPDQWPNRKAWVGQYEKKAEDYSACRFVEWVGSGVEDSTCRAVQTLHDELCGADSDRPLA